MTLHADDPRLTAYVLGELKDDERAEFERALAESPEAARELEEIRETIALVRRELTTEPLPSHDVLAGGLLEPAADSHADPEVPSTVSPAGNTHLKWRLASYAAAAALLVAVGYATLPQGDSATSQGVAFLPSPPSSESNQWGYAGGVAIKANSQDAPPTPSGDVQLTPQATSLGLTLQTAQDQTQPPRAGTPYDSPANTNSPPADGRGYFMYVEGTTAGPSSQLPALAGAARGREVGLTTLDGSAHYEVTPGQASNGHLAYTIAKPVYETKPADRFKGPVTTYGVDPLQRRMPLERQGDNLSMLLVTPRIIVQEEEEQLLGVQSYNTEAYASIVENPFLGVMQNPLSTFSIDVDTASYSNVRRLLTAGTLPPPGAVRIEEMLNYFTYDYAPPAETETAPFAAHLEVAECPWRPEHRLVRIGLKGREIASEDRPASNLVFLLDVSGSMNKPNKLPLVKEGLRMLVNGLRENDRVAIVVYAGASGMVLDSTSGDNKETILAVIDQLTPGGSTNGASGIQLAYDVAKKHFVKEGTNRVILATDGDFNVGITDQSQLVELIEEQAKTGVFLSVLGFGMGNLKDSTLEQLADRGNGNYAYIDSDREARKVLVEQLSGTLVTIAKDVKIQLEFNPARVAAYRLIGYENRLLAKEDFNDDTKDAGEIGAGHTVTALYEVVLTNAEKPGSTDENKQDDEAIEREVDELEYLSVARPTEAALASPNLLTLKLRYKEPEGTESKLLKFPVEDAQRRIGEASTDFQLAASVAAFGMLLRGSQFAGSANLDAVMEWAQPTLSSDLAGYRRELVDLMRTARELMKAQQPSQQQQ